MKHVLVYYMDPAELASAKSILGHMEETESFVMGEADDEQIARLRADGLIVQEQSATRHPVEAVEDTGLLSFGLDTAVPAEVDYYLVSLRGPLLESRRQELNGMGVTLGDAQPDGRYKTKLTSAQVGKVHDLPYVEKVEWISPPAPQAESGVLSAGEPSFGIEEPLMFDIRLHDPADVPKIEAWLRGKSLQIIGTGTRKIRFFSAPDAPVLDELAALPEVDGSAQQYITPVVWNEYAIRLLGVDDALVGTVPGHRMIAQDGTGQIVGVADTGIDDAHPDFQGRIVAKIARGRMGDTTDPIGHGTHVAGSILGDGAASGGRIQGVAPRASLFFQSMSGPNGKLTGIPVNLNDLFEEAYQGGARIHNNSWGIGADSNYTMMSEEVDEFVSKRRDMLVVIAAGNTGSSFQPRKADPGFVDWLSICAPASSKNALTVGASRSDRPDGPRSTMTWAEGFPNSFPSPPIAGETISGDPNSLAAFSSRGPCTDHRIKPDVVAPGTDILSTKSSLAQNFWGLFPVHGLPKDPHYAFDGGTSMAAPLVAGCAALIRQYYVDTAGHAEPSAALLKATLVNSTQWLTGADATAKTLGRPNYHQGHGRVSMAFAVPNASQPGLEVRFVDDWKTFQFAATGQQKRYRFVLTAVAPELRICMAYTDAPARSLQNDLNLFVKHVDSSTTFLGNQSLPDSLTQTDGDNNLEAIRIPNAQAGTYFVFVKVTNLLKPPQDFALVVTGVGVPPLAEF